MITINNQFRSNYLLFFMCSVILSPCLLAHIFVFFVHLCRQKQRTVKQKGYDIWNHIVCMSEVCGLNCFWVKNSAICGFHGVLYEKWISKQSNKTWNIITSKQASLQSLNRVSLRRVEWYLTHSLYVDLLATYTFYLCISLVYFKLRAFCDQF